MSYSTATGYNYTQRGDVVLTTRTGTTRNVPSNYKPYILLKGVDTTITFFVKDENACAIRLHNIQLNAKLIKKGAQSISLNKNLRVVNYEGGIVSLTVNSAEIQSLEPGFYILVLTYTDDSGLVTALYSDQNRRVEFVTEVKNNVLPALEEAPTVSGDSFQPIAPEDQTTIPPGVQLPVYTLPSGQYGITSPGTYAIMYGGNDVYYAISVSSNDGGVTYYVTEGATIQLMPGFGGAEYGGLSSGGTVVFYGVVPQAQNLTPNVYYFNGGEYGVPSGGYYAVIPNGSGGYFYQPATTSDGGVTYDIDYSYNPTLLYNFDGDTYNSITPAGTTNYIGGVPTSVTRPYNVYNLIGGTYGIPSGGSGQYGIIPNGDGTFSYLPIGYNPSTGKYYTLPGATPIPLTGFSQADLDLLPNLGTVPYTVVTSDNGGTVYGTGQSAGQPGTSGGSPMVSGRIPGPAQLNNPNGLNTIAIYARNATGTFETQATLEIDPTTDSDWFDVALTTGGGGTLRYDNHTGVDAFVFDGMFYWIRFKKNITQGSIDKIMYRA